MKPKAWVWISGSAVLVAATALLIVLLARPTGLDRFKEAHAAFKKKTSRIRLIRRKADTFQGAERAQAVREYRQLVEELDELMPRLEQATIEAYLDDPTEDNEASRFMAYLLGYLVNGKRHEAAERVGQLMIKHQHPKNIAHDLLGRNAFFKQDFKAAEAYFQTALENDSLSVEGRRMRAAIREMAEQERLKKAADKAMNNKQQILDAYRSNPNQDPKVTQEIWHLLNGLAQAERYAEAVEVGRLMIQSAHPETRTAALAAQCAFWLNDFDLADELLSAVDEPGPHGERLRKDIDDYKKFWKTEQALREAEAKADNLPRVVLETSQGTIVLELFENEAPNTVANFIHLVENKFYDGLVFHRVLANFMAQGGCPKGNGTGGPGWTIACECYKDDARRHFRGSLSMAHRGRDTGGSQFFLTFVPTPSSVAWSKAWRHWIDCSASIPSRPSPASNRTKSSRPRSCANGITPTRPTKSSNRPTRS